MLHSDKYLIKNKIYENNKEVVYRAEEIDKNIHVIIKYLKVEMLSYEEKKKFQDRYNVSKTLNVSSIVNVYEIIDDDSTKAVIMEDFDGITLKDFMVSHDFSLKELLEYFIKIAGVLGKIHNLNIIYKGINPSNILINHKQKKIKFMNFGISSEKKANEASVFSLSEIEENLQYISPEQTGRTSASVDFYSDLYALGILFYEMTTKRHPFPFKDPVEIIHAHIARRPVPPSEINKNIPKIVSDIILKLLSKIQSERYRNAYGLISDLQQCLYQVKVNNKIDYFEIGKNDYKRVLQIPDKIFGREKEITHLHHIAREANHNKQLVFIHGKAGTGKSFLINKFCQQVAKKDTYSAVGKFDQYQSIPYSAFIQAFTGLIKQLLSESKERLAIWQAELNNALGQNGQVITDVIPELELIIGKQNNVPQLELQQTLNRFNQTFLKFLSVFTNGSYPLIIFIDDIQWADKASLNLLEALIRHKTNNKLLIILTSRFSKRIEILEKRWQSIDNDTINFTSIKLDVFNHDQIQEIIKNILYCSDFTAGRIADLIIEKTDGSSFFILQFLKELYNKGLIKYNDELLTWQYHFESDGGAELSENIMELMIYRFNYLSTYSLNLLKIASCMGNCFNIQGLAEINLKIELEILDDLSEAIEQELILPVFSEDREDREYMFAHDRIQQALYNLLDKQTRSSIHGRIGKYYLKAFGKEKLQENIFKIVEQLNKTSELIITDEDRIHRVRLNLLAAQKAKSSAAYESACFYLKTGMKLAKYADWNDHHVLIFDLYKLRIKIEFLLGNFDFSQSLIKSTLDHTLSHIEKGEIYSLLLVQYTMQSKYSNAIKVADTALQLLGISYLQDDINSMISLELERFKEQLQKESFYNNLGPMNDKEKIIAMDILSKAITSSYIFDNTLWKYTVIKAVDLSLEYGYTSGTDYAFAAFANVLVSQGEYKMAHAVGQLAMKLVSKLNDCSQKCKVYEVISGHLFPWVKPINHSYAISIMGYEAGLESGELQFASYIKMLVCLLNRVADGENLQLIIDDLDEFWEFNRATKNILMLDFLIGIQNIAEDVTGKRMKNNFSRNSKFIEKEYLLNCQNNNSLLAICYYNIFKQQQCFLFYEYQKGIQYAEKADVHLKYIANTIMNSEHNWYYSLCLTVNYNNVSEEEKKRYLEKIRDNQKKMKVWAKNCKENFLHKFLLVEAEIERIEKNYSRAENLYDDAIRNAQENMFVQDEAVCNELAASFYFEKGKPNISSLFLKEAGRLFELWGAHKKVTYLKSKNPAIFNKLYSYTSSSKKNISYAVDFQTFTNISQSISKEIKLESLIKRFLKILLELAGAEKGIFLMKSEEEWVVQSCVDLDNALIIQNIPVNEYAQIPQSIINYVSRTKDNIVIHNACEEGLFIHDPYIIENKIKSIFCIPIIYLNNLKGIIYLENNVTVGAFINEYIEMISLLSTQIAVSIENALMFQQLVSSNTQLEKKVEARTSEIKKTIEKLEFEINERKKAEATLLESKKRYRSLVELMPDMLFIKDQDKIIFVNDAGLKFLGHRHSHDIIGKKFSQLFDPHPDYEQQQLNNLEKFNNDEEMVLFEEKLIRKSDGQVFYVETSMRSIQYCRKKVNLHLCRDISERKRAENLREKAEQNERLLNEALKYDQLKTEFFANMSHEFKTPLNVLLGAVQMMQVIIDNKSFESDFDKVKLYSKIMKQNCFRLIRLVNNIIDITKIDSGYFNYKPRPHDIVKVAKDITLSVAEYVGNHGIKLKFDFSTEEKIILGDPEKIERIILNLLSNAVKFTEPGGSIYVKIYSIDHNVVISIKDTGIGIPLDKQKMIFKRFMQIDKSLSRNKEGSGIGLSLVEAIVDLHGGDISLNSEVGQGSEFLIKLPVANGFDIQENEQVDESRHYKDSDNIEKIIIEFSDIYFN